MLGKRIATAAVALPLTVLAILFLPTLGLAALVAVLMLLAAWEWGGMASLHGLARLIFMACTALLIGWVLEARCVDGSFPVGTLLFGLSAAFWLAVVGLVIRFPEGWKGTLGWKPIGLFVGLIVLATPVAAVAYLDEADQGPLLILVLCLMIWGADTGAYAAGRMLGRHRLVPRVSPGKTLEGGIGGLLIAMIVGSLSALVLGYDGSRTLAMALLGAWIAVVSIVGDLTLSMFKRSAGIKDSGRLFPGHGGVLDRLDSMLAAAPWFVIGLHVVLRAT